MIGFSNLAVTVFSAGLFPQAIASWPLWPPTGLVRGEKGLSVYMMCKVLSKIILAEKFAARFDGFPTAPAWTVIRRAKSSITSKLRSIMSSRQPVPDARATRVVISIFGSVVGLAAIEHGVGEISQGSVRPASLLIQSWPDTAAFSVLAGEPALTVLPTYFLSGILTVIVALVLSVWSVFFVQRRGGGLVLILLSLILLLFGGGLGPPLIGLILGVAALRMHALPPLEVRRLLLPLARVWKGALVAGIAGYLALLPGTVLLYYFAGVANETMVYGLALFSFAALILSLVAARTADRLAAERRG